MAPQLNSADYQTSTLLVTNIHCPSCVSYATDVLAPLRGSVHQIDISIIEHTIRIQHVNGITNQLVEELLGAAFEVEHVTVSNSQGQILREYNVKPVKSKLPNTFLETLFMSKAQKKHIQNCDACQQLRGSTRDKKTAWADILRLRRTKQRSAGTDIEHDAIRSESLVSSTQHGGSSDGSPALQAKLSGEEYVAVLSIEGMTCASCVSAITNELQQQQFIRSVNVNLIANSARVIFHGQRQRVNEIKDSIEDIGYGASVEEVESLKQETSSSDLYKATLSIVGMTCGSCVGTITRGLQELPALESVDVDLVNNSANVTFHKKHNLDDILEKISDLGYDASVASVHEVAIVSSKNTTSERSVQLRVDGMYCPNCPTNLTNAINKTFSGSVRIDQVPSLRNPLMTVVYRPSVPDLTIRRVVEVMNSVDPACSISVYHPPSLEERSRSIRRKERDRVLRHLFVALLIAIPSFIIGVVYMSLMPATNSTKQWFEEPIWAGNAMRMDWALFIMTTPAMFYAANLFHTRAFKEIWTLWRPKSKVPLLRRFYRFGSMNLLISAGTSVAYFASLAVLIMDATTPRQDHEMGRKSITYFDTVTFLTLFILIGRFLEAYSKSKTGDAVSMLAQLRPSTAILVESGIHQKEGQQNTVLKEVSVDLLEAGDIISIPHGSSPATDGIIEQDGDFVFDESSLTGESRPAKKRTGDDVFTGTINIGNPVRIKVTEIGGKSMLDQIVNVVREGQAKRAPIERLADTLTGYFTPVITLLAILTWVIWLALGISGAIPSGWLDVGKGGWAYWSVEFAIAVFVVACPCGIGLAAPTALFVGGGLAAKNGILVQGGGEAFQEASRLNAIVFDKTGTLTEGSMRVTEVQFLEGDFDCPTTVAYAVTKSLEEASTHPIAKAIAQYCDGELSNESAPEVMSSSIKEIPGHGMSGKFDIQIGREVRTYEAIIGNERLFNAPIEELASTKEGAKSRTQVTTPVSNVFLTSSLSRFQSSGNTTAILAVRILTPTNDLHSSFTPIAVFAITDPLRREAPEVLASLRSQGLSVYMCTGDNPQTAQSIAAQLSIPVSNVRAGVLPQGKAAFIQELQQAAGPNTARQIIAFVGDGTNDTPALTVADVSIALSHSSSSTTSGSDIALTTSSFILLTSSLHSITTLIKLSKRVFLRVRLNFLWAAIYNICLIPVAAGVFFPIGATWNGADAHSGFRLSPVWASVAMAGSSVSVVLSSLALRLPEIEPQQWWRKATGGFSRRGRE